MLYCIDMLVLDANILRDSILVRLETIQFECYVHVNAVMWRVVYRELRALTNDGEMGLNPMELNDVYEDLWNVGTLLQNETDVLSIMEDEFRPWAKVKSDTEKSRAFYDVHDRAKQNDLALLRSYESWADLERLCRGAEKGVQSFRYVRHSTRNPSSTLFTSPLQNTNPYTRNALGEAIHESLTRTMGNYLEATGGCLANRHKNAWEKDIAARMICTNNAAEGPFATVRAFLHIYPSLKLRTVATLSAAIVNGTHRPAHKVPHTITQTQTLALVASIEDYDFFLLCGECRTMSRMRCPVFSFKLPWTHMNLSRFMCREGSLKEKTGHRI